MESLVNLKKNYIQIVVKIDVKKSYNKILLIVLDLKE